MTVTCTQLIHTATTVEVWGKQRVAVLQNRSPDVKTSPNQIGKRLALTSSTKQKQDVGKHANQEKEDAKTQVMVKESPSTKEPSLDRFLQGYNGFMWSGANQEKMLKCLQYCLWMISFFLLRERERQEDCDRLVKELESARYILRFLGLPPALEAARSVSWSFSSAEYPKLQQFLGKLLAWTMVGYYPLEHAAYLLWYSPKLIFPTSEVPFRLAEALSMWSCRCWLAYVFVEILQNGLQYYEETQKARKYAEQKKNDSQELLSAKPPRPATMKYLRLQLVRASLHLLPAIHWSLRNSDIEPWLSLPFVNTLMWLESVVCMIQGIASFQS
ncbi:Peroxisomal biogenesis factor 11 (PEX11) [Seminavis robusta]|uniref:Peroxisomal biogenesis factor 11 (PEX11) n=1 Tax=Seminavis robusta TaxID=568900 RepID=A0A9N8D4L8_9STRA|nr:Peroxisomal biogenesis factor 11 (PEX11) [Seminavis robusta]|eukprot:Sro4_g003270.1 Peroxisomal biogenesis factor 11 (PEX11) (329) ;mRNA; r:98929-99915